MFHGSLICLHRRRGAKQTGPKAYLQTDGGHFVQAPCAFQPSCEPVQMSIGRMEGNGTRTTPGSAQTSHRSSFQALPTKHRTAYTAVHTEYVCNTADTGGTATKTATTKKTNPSQDKNTFSHVEDLEPIVVAELKANLVLSRSRCLAVRVRRLQSTTSVFRCRAR